MQKQWSEYFVPDFEVGTLTWAMRPSSHFKSDRTHRMWNTRFCGKAAGTIDVRGYVRVSVNKRVIDVHRIIWEMANGPIPTGFEIDHKDERKGNNALQNLRLATRSQNLMNKGKQSNNTSGYKGVSSYRGKWKAQIKASCKLHLLGIYNTKWGAYAAYREAAVKHHGSFSKF